MLDNELDELLNDTPAAEPSANHKRKSLGRGLNALLGDDFDDDVAPVKSTESINVADIVACKFQPRTEFDADALQALADSIKEKGVLQPLLVRHQGDKYELIAGERRWRAAQMAGLAEVPVIIKDLSDAEVLEAALVENILRENLSAIEEAEGYQRLIDEFSHTQEALSQIIGKSRSHIANMLRLLTLPDEVKVLVKEGKISAGHARALVGTENPLALAKLIIDKDLSVRQTEDMVAKQKEPKADKPQPKPKQNEDIAEIEQSLTKALGLRIKISADNKGGGKVVLQYSSVAELDEIVELLEQKHTAERKQNTVFKEPKEPETNEKFSIKLVD